MAKNTPLIKGIITGIAMIGFFLFFYSIHLPADSPYQYILDILYAGGITWTLLSYYRSTVYNPSFRAIFGQGFRCFIVVTFIMVLFTAVFYWSHPEIAKESATNYREWSIQNEKDMTPAERDKAVATYEARFNTNTISFSIFGYLVRGVIFTVAGTALLIMRRK
jgi:hypothetical protein